MIQDRTEVVFWHEVIHIILGKLCKNELNDDESFVNIMGLLIHEVIKTSKGVLK